MVPLLYDVRKHVRRPLFSSPPSRQALHKPFSSLSPTKEDVSTDLKSTSTSQCQAALPIAQSLDLLVEDMHMGESVVSLAAHKEDVASQSAT